MKWLFLIPALFNLVFLLPALGQKPEKIRFDNYPELSLRTSLTSFFDYDAGIMLGVNYRWTEKFAVTLEPTWIFYNGFRNDLAEERIYPSGIKLRADVRYYFLKKRRKGLDLFIAPELHFKAVRTRKLDDFGVNCQNRQCAYIQQAFYTEVKKETGGIFKLGLLVPLLSNSDQLYLEMYGGFGMKLQKYRETDLPVGGSFLNPPNRNFFQIGVSSNGNIISAPLIPVGIKLILVLH